MKYFNFFRNLALASFIGVSGLASAQSQTSHPLSFPAIGTSTVSNFYKDYVGIRFQVSSPASIAGDKIYTSSYTGTVWGGAPVAFSAHPIKFGPASDTGGCSAYPTGYFTGHIALVWRGVCEFGAKALAAQTAGADAVVIVNNISGGPVGMAAGASGSLVHIPVYMISLEDGTAIANILNTGGEVTLTTNLNWASGNPTDLGFVPEGYSISANNAMPRTQLNTHAAPYRNIDGAFIANYGTTDVTNVQLHGSLSFTPSGDGGASAIVIHTDSSLLASFPVSDSVYTMYAPEYDVPTATTNGKYDLTYNISLSSDFTDGFLGDNTVTYSFYTTDSLYSKGRYDFANNRPFAALYTVSASTDPYIWGVPYYIANGGDVFKKAQFSLSGPGGPGLLNGSMNVYIFKWVDGSGSVAADSFMENDEFTLVGMGTRNFDGVTDSSFQFFNVDISADTLDDSHFNQVFTESNTWYVVGAEVPAGFGLGTDGVVSGYPRSYGRGHFPANNYAEYYNPIWGGDRSSSTTPMVAVPNGAWLPWAFNGTGSFDIDSVEYSSQKGLIPALPFSVSSHPSAVNNVAADYAKFNLYPNPASGYVNVTLDLGSNAKQVTYTIIDNSARVIKKETRNNVGTEPYTINTSNLATGTYYMVINADDKHSFKKFTVLR